MSTRLLFWLPGVLPVSSSNSAAETLFEADADSPDGSILSDRICENWREELRSWIGSGV